MALAPRRLLLGRAVEGDKRLVDLDLCLGVHTADGIKNLAVDGIDGLAHALAEIALAAIAQFNRLMCAGRGPGGDGRAAPGPVLEHDIDLDGRIAAAVEDLASDDVGDGSHEVPNGWQCSRGFYRIENALVMPRESEASSDVSPALETGPPIARWE